MARRVLLSDALPFYKGNLHAHSTLTDGKQTPEHVKEVFKRHGYSFIAITDHDRCYAHPELNDEEFLTLTSFEMSIKEFPEKGIVATPNMKVCHLNFYAKDPTNDVTLFYDPDRDSYSSAEDRARLIDRYGACNRVYSAESINEMIRVANEQGFFVAYNHPRWSNENYTQYGQYEGLWGVEVFNTASWYAGLHEDAVHVAEDLLHDGKRVFLSCGDDNHSDDISCVAFVMVNAPSLTYANIVDGLLCGNFYASTGPLFHSLTVEDGTVHVTCSDVRQISFSTQGRRSASVRAKQGETVTTAAFPLKEGDEYFRIALEDEHGQRAYSQPYFVDEL